MSTGRQYVKNYAHHTSVSLDEETYNQVGEVAIKQNRKRGEVLRNLIMEGLRLVQEQDRNTQTP